ncbi:MAG: zinc carboxypeptidase [Candidatus Aminicenantes bacterium]|nr:MAG: zinc carboxypeptidase [Candidatus Aminicenantes bacterium]
MIMKKTVALMILVSFISIAGESQDYWTTEIISIEKDYKIEKKLREMNLDFLMEWNDRVYIIVNHDELQTIEKENILFTLETQNLYPQSQKITIQSGVNGEYHSYSELEQELLTLQDSYPNLARVFDIGDSLEQRNIYALKISDNVNQDENEAEVAFLGCHHAREWISVEVPFLLGKYLVENYNSNSKIKELVDSSEIWIVPLVNPDGLEYSIHFYRYWRKNRRDNGDGSYGVDLNRNYGYMWGYDNKGSSPNPSDVTYRGKSAFSEPETQVIRDLFSLRSFQAMITYHNYSQIIIYPWGYTRLLTEKDDLFFEMSADMSELIQSVNGNFYDYGPAGVDLYLTNGDTTDWTFGTYGIPSFTIELPPIDIPHGGFFNSEGDIQPIFNENLPAMLYLIEWSIDDFEAQSNLPEKRKPKFKSKDQSAGEGRGNNR